MRTGCLRSLGMTQSKHETGLRLIADHGEIVADQPPHLTVDGEDENLYKASKFVRIDPDKKLELARMATAKIIQYRDLAVFDAMIALTDWRDGKCRAPVSGIAETLGWSISQTGHSMRRLKAAKVIVPLIEKVTRAKIHIFNPYIVIYGTGKRRGYLIRKYHEALYANAPYSVTM